jgi:uncharacterized Zn finger protein (UPF0148 family)
MSAYFDIPVETSVVVCPRCKTPTFAWLAEVFLCNKCGAKFDLADDEEADSVISKEESHGAANISNGNKEGEKPTSDSDEKSL